MWNRWADGKTSDDALRFLFSLFVAHLSKTDEALFFCRPEPWQIKVSYIFVLDFLAGGRCKDKCFEVMSSVFQATLCIMD